MNIVEILSHSDIPLTTATLLLTGATVVLWGDRQKQAMKARLKHPLKHHKVHAEYHQDKDGVTSEYDEEDDYGGHA